jgi:hypothetical protein
VHIDEIVERSGLNSSEVLATLFDLEMKGVIRQMPGKQFSKVLLLRQIGVCIVGPGPASNSKTHPQGQSPHQNVDPVGIRAERIKVARRTHAARSALTAIHYGVTKARWHVRW